MTEPYTQAALEALEEFNETFRTALHELDTEAYTAGYKQGQEDGWRKSETSWIRCYATWPPMDEPVLIRHQKNTANSKVAMLRWDITAGWPYWETINDWKRIEIDDVTHWARLTEPDDEAPPREPVKGSDEAEYAEAEANFKKVQELITVGKIGDPALARLAPRLAVQALSLAQACKRVFAENERLTQELADLTEQKANFIKSLMPDYDADVPVNPESEPE